MKILWGIFAFPSMYPGAYFRAAGLPLLGIIAITFLWVGRQEPGMPSLSTWVLVFVNWLLFAWLAVRLHRLVLLGGHEDELPPRLRSVANYFGAIVVAGLTISVSHALIFMRYVPGAGGAPEADGMTGLSAWITWPLQIAPLYLLARLSPVLPELALNRGWKPVRAWRTSLGNGWRLFAVVFLLPWAFDAVVDLAYDASSSAIVTGLLVTLRALLIASGIIALSLAYRELTASPAQPPTTPPA